MSIQSEIDRGLAQLSPITLAEMDSVSLMNRVDAKYLASDRLLPDLLESLRHDYRVLEVGGLRRSPYSTLYFDTAGRQCYHAHHNGRANRFKYRKRSYVASGDSFFEIKLKTNRGRTVKQRIAIADLAPSLDTASAALVASVALKPLELLPQVWTMFSRITMVGREIAERVTIDLDLEFREGDHTRMMTGAMIVEVKQEKDSRHSPLRQKLRQLHVPPMRVSKYCVASALLDPTLKRNRFKTKLMALENLSN